MIHVKYVPRRDDHFVSYAFAGDRITATLDGQSDVFDFSGLPDGEAGEITSTLDPCPVLAARRVNGELHVTLLRAIGPRPQPRDYETSEDYQASLDAWRRLWTDDLEVVIDG